MNNIDPKQLTAIEIKLDHLTANLFRLQKSVEANNVYESGHLYLTDVIEDKYKYYSGFSYNKDLTALAKLNYLTDIFFDKRDDAECQRLDQQYTDALLDNWVTDEENEVLKIELKGYKEALEEIAKRPRKAETCKLIAKKALGLLSDDDYQPELLIEENLELRMKIEDLESKLITETLEEIHPFMHCHYCGELKGYHHEKNCIHQKFLDLQSRFNVCEGLKQQYYNQLCENGLAEYGN